MNQYLLTTFLYPTQTAANSFGRLFDFAGTMDSYNTALSPAQADRLALMADWAAVKQDLDFAIASHESDVMDHQMNR